MIRLPRKRDIKYTDTGRYVINWVEFDEEGRIIPRRAFFSSFARALIELDQIIENVRDSRC